MSRLRVHSFSMSLHGFSAGRGQDLRNPLGVHGPEMMEWLFHTRTWRAMHGQAGGEAGVDDEIAQRGFGSLGAWILGRNILLASLAAGLAFTGCVATAGQRAGRMPVTWYAGGAVCDGRPVFHVHEYHPGFFILRQPACTNYEKPFLYLLVGRSRALLLDTGAGDIAVAQPVDSILDAWRTRHDGTPRELVVAHSHGHGDHVAGDGEFRGRPGVTLVERDTGAVRAYFGFRAWPADIVQFDLGGRVVDVLAIPGHEAAGLAFHDRTTAVLLTGDTFYPGRLYVRDTAAFAASTARLVHFTAARPVSAILGTHIEQTRTPFTDYPVGTRDQPDEDRLELSRADLVTLDSTVRGMRGRFTRTRLPRFTIWPL